MNETRGEPAVRVTLEFRPVNGRGLCFDDAHGDFGPSALTNVEALLKGMVHSILEKRALADMSHTMELSKIPKHHTAKRRDCKARHKARMEIYDDERAIVEAAMKTARYDVISNWNWSALGD